MKNSPARSACSPPILANTSSDRTPRLELTDLRAQVRPGSILDARPLPHPPIARVGLFHALGKLLGSHRRIADLRTEFLHVIALLERNAPERASLRLDRIAAHLREIRRDGTQFVLSLQEWDSIIAVGADTLKTAQRAGAQPELLATLETLLERLEEFGSGKLQVSR